MRQGGDGRQLRPAALVLAVLVCQRLQGVQQFDGVIALALDQAHADLLAQQVGDRAHLPQAAQVGNLLAQEAQGRVRAFLQQVKTAAAQVGAHDDIGYRGVQQAEAIGNQLAGVVDPVQFIECVGQQAGAEVGAD
ncbi:hypothetical protein D3C78_1130100 [compost metagenome]